MILFQSVLIPSGQQKGIGGCQNGQEAVWILPSLRDGGFQARVHGLKPMPRNLGFANANSGGARVVLNPQKGSLAQARSGYYKVFAGTSLKFVKGVLRAFLLFHVAAD